jgi:hypothetical protein
LRQLPYGKPPSFAVGPVISCKGLGHQAQQQCLQLTNTSLPICCWYLYVCRPHRCSPPVDHRADHMSCWVHRAAPRHYLRGVPIWHREGPSRQQRDRRVRSSIDMPVRAEVLQ